MNRAAVLAAIAAVAYLPSLAGPFHFDDYNVIVHYPTVHSWSALFERAGAGVRALLKASYALNWTLDPAPWGFHLVNIALHALNTVLVFLLGRQLLGQLRASSPTGAAFVAALLFALHPMQTEAVTYISGRSSSLMAAFYLAALLLYVRGAHWSITSLLFVLALATRETAATLPAAMLLLELARGTPWRAAMRRQAAHWLLFAAGAVFVLLSPRYLEHVAFGFTQRTLADNLLTQIGGVSYLVWHLLVPRGLNIDPALPTLAEWSTPLALQLTGLLALLALGFANLRRRPWIAFGVLWFFLQLAPTNSVIPRLDVANDRQLYLAGWGLFLALTAQVAQLELRPFALRAAAAAACVAFAGANLVRQYDYRDEVALWETSVKSSPWNARARNNLGYAYYQVGRKADARREFETALALDRREQKARANLVLLDWD